MLVHDVRVMGDGEMARWSGVRGFVVGGIGGGTSIKTLQDMSDGEQAPGESRVPTGEYRCRRLRKVGDRGRLGQHEEADERDLRVDVVNPNPPSNSDPNVMIDGLGDRPSLCLTWAGVARSGEAAPSSRWPR